MDSVLRAIELSGQIDENNQLHLDTPLPFSGPGRVKVIILFSEEIDLSEIDEAQWLKAAANNEAFDFLKAPEEDIYTLSDGKPFNG